MKWLIKGLAKWFIVVPVTILTILLMAGFTSRQEVADMSATTAADAGFTTGAVVHGLPIFVSNMNEAGTYTYNASHGQSTVPQSAQAKAKANAKAQAKAAKEKKMRDLAAQACSTEKTTAKEQACIKELLVANGIQP